MTAPTVAATTTTTTIAATLGVECENTLPDQLDTRDGHSVAAAAVVGDGVGNGVGGGASATGDSGKKL